MSGNAAFCGQLHEFMATELLAGRYDAYLSVIGAPTPAIRAFQSESQLSSWQAAIRLEW
jgi:hypothetical protein